MVSNFLRLASDWKSYGQPCLVFTFIGLSPMGMSSVKQGMRFGWNVKNFAQNLLISPRSTRGQSTANLEVGICRWGGRGD